MPFSQTTPEHTEEYWDKQYYFLKTLIEENSEFIAHRSEPLRGDIVRQIINDLVVSPIVVADITDKNANVFWELGVRQSFKHGTITIAEQGTKVPFDIGGKGTLFYYPKDHIKMKSFTTKFKEAIKDCLSNPDRPDSQVLESITGRGTLFETIHRDEINRRLDAVLYECDLNLDCIKIINTLAEKNLKSQIQDRRYAPFLHLSSKTIEFLVISRYINSPKEFYELSAKYLNSIDAINSTLMKWINNSTEDEINEQLIFITNAITKGIEYIKQEIRAYRKDN